MIKINGDTISGAEDFCPILAEMSHKGLEEWGIDALTLPITYGRYKNPLAKAFDKMRKQKGTRFSYIHKCSGSAFQTRAEEISSSYTETQVALPPNMDDDD